ncbi:MAG: hypothetical protein WA667_05240 [Candidatus Nitrosopolaris sp.]
MFSAVTPVTRWWVGLDTIGCSWRTYPGAEHSGRLNAANRLSSVVNRSGGLSGVVAVYIIDDVTGRRA